LPGRVKKRAFLATDGIVSPDPDFFPLPNRHHWIELTSADQVQASWQVSQARAQRAVTYKGEISRNSRLRPKFENELNI
jgi:cell wall assembly regulator SMI1